VHINERQGNHGAPEDMTKALKAFRGSPPAEKIAWLQSVALRSGVLTDLRQCSMGAIMPCSTQ
jgi:hypothetical protein